MRKTRHLGLAPLFALLLVGGLAACSPSDKGGIVLTVSPDSTVLQPPKITSLQVTVNGTTKTYDLPSGLSGNGTLGIKTSPGDKSIVVDGFAQGNRVATGTGSCPATGGKVLTCTVVLHAIAGDAGAIADASPSSTGGAPGFDANPGSDVPASTGGSGGIGGATTFGGTTGTGGVTNPGGTTGVGGVTSTGGLSSIGGSSAHGGSLDAGGGAPGLDASSGTDAPTSGGSGGTGGVTTSGGTTRTGGSAGTGGATSTGGATRVGGQTGGSSATAGTTSTGGSTGGTTSTGGAAGGATKLVATAVAAAWDHSCALIKDGTIWCWGNNSDGELGNQDPKIDGTAVIYETKPVQVKGVTQAISVATGDYHTCAALASGTVQCWGYNGYGQLGNGASGRNSRSITPTAVIGMPAGVGGVAVVAGSSHTCALLSDKTVRCWGDNTYDQLGSGSSTLTSSTVPVAVVTNASTLSPLTNVTTLALTTDHACAIQSGGALYCWGDNLWGQLGTGTTNSTTVAVRAGTIQAVAVGTGDGHTCVVGSPTTGSPFNVQCWGRDSYGELGDNGSSGDEIHTPVNARVSANASAIALGADHSCAVLVNPSVTVQCWGDNAYGQLGNGNTGDSPVPVDALSLTQAKFLSAGEGDTCAVVSSGAVYCWGHNDYGQLGDGNGGPDTQSAVPVLVSGF
jgi:alpha-tubulin suppressor-like RCC1 family protein